MFDMFKRMKYYHISYQWQSGDKSGFGDAYAYNKGTLNDDTISKFKKSLKIDLYDKDLPNASIVILNIIRINK